MSNIESKKMNIKRYLLIFVVINEREGSDKMDEDLKVIKSIVMEEPVVLEFCCKTDSI
jgi:hypothetical protein